MHASTYIPLRIIDIKSETSDTKSFVLSPANGQQVSYQVGQFLTLVFQKKDREERRSYSISSTALLHEPLTITAKRIDNGEYSRYLFDEAKVGDILLTIGASGYFTLPESIADDTHFFFLAAGSGITPILPLMKTLLHFHPSVSVTLLYSSRNAEATIFYDVIQDLARQFPVKLNIQYLFSSSQNLLHARLSKVKLIQHIHTHHIPKDKTIFYLCGPSGYMQMATIALLTEGIPKENIRKENFSTIKPILKELPPDTEAHMVTLIYNEVSHKIKVQYPDTILEAGKRSGLPLPYSCEAGKCGTCAATCIQGNIWHSYNEVLVDRELQKGRVLTCTGYPIGKEPVIIRFDK